jgi:hypothetical protein
MWVYALLRGRPAGTVAQFSSCITKPGLEAAAASILLRCLPKLKAHLEAKEQAMSNALNHATSVWNLKMAELCQRDDVDRRAATNAAARTLSVLKQQQADHECKQKGVANSALEAAGLLQPQPNGAPSRVPDLLAQWAADYMANLAYNVHWTALEDAIAGSQTAHLQLMEDMRISFYKENNKDARQLSWLISEYIARIQGS